MKRILALLTVLVMFAGCTPPRTPQEQMNNAAMIGVMRGLGAGLAHPQPNFNPYGAIPPYYVLPRR